MDSTIKAAWDRIAGWYAVHVPTGQFRLATGATADEIADTERELGVSLPPDVVASYRLHNGSDERAVFPYGYYLLSLDDMTYQWKFQRKLEAEDAETPPAAPTELARDEPIQRVWWNRQWLPFTHNSGGDHHFVDLDPAQGGTIGQVIKFNHEVGPQHVLAPSLSTFLVQFAGDLEAGLYRFDEDELNLVRAAPLKGTRRRKK